MKSGPLTLTALICLVGITMGYVYVAAIMLFILVGAIFVGVVVGVYGLRKEHHAKSAQGQKD